MHQLPYRDDYEKRIKDIILDAEFDGVVAEPRSESDLWNFLSSVPNAMKASIVLGDDGCFSVVWLQDNLGKLSIEFLGNGDLIYSMLRLDEGTPIMPYSYTCGREQFAGVKGRILDFGFGSFLGI